MEVRFLCFTGTSKMPSPLDSNVMYINVIPRATTEKIIHEIYTQKYYRQIKMEL